MVLRKTNVSSFPYVQARENHSWYSWTMVYTKNLISQLGLTTLPFGRCIFTSIFHHYSLASFHCRWLNAGILMLWNLSQALIFSDANAIKENSVKLGAGEDLYALFAAILTMKPWNRIIDPSVDHLVIKGDDSERSERQVCQSSYKYRYALGRIIVLLIDKLLLHCPHGCFPCIYYLLYNL